MLKQHTPTTVQNTTSLVLTVLKGCVHCWGLMTATMTVCMKTQAGHPKVAGLLHMCSKDLSKMTGIVFGWLRSHKRGFAEQNCAGKQRIWAHARRTVDCHCGNTKRLCTELGLGAWLTQPQAGCADGAGKVVSRELAVRTEESQKHGTVSYSHAPHSRCRGSGQALLSRRVLHAQR